jgi:hypothetical protein
MTASSVVGALLIALGSVAVWGDESDKAVTHRLTAQNRSAVQPWSANVRTSGKQFIAIEVLTVSNPQQLAVLFEVHHRPAGGEQKLLGGFALYPPDRPGRFLVPSEGADGDGELVLSLVLPDTEAADARLEVTAGEMKPVSAEEL